MQKGDIVRCSYKTGVYAGEVFEIRGENKPVVVKILAVLKHPLQGDLHNPKQTDVQLFHERPALSFNEKANIPPAQVKPFEQEVPPYRQSLEEAVKRYEDELQQEDTAFAEACYKALQSVKDTYRSRDVFTS
ncbi:kinase-associated lipoprotein B [Alkalicoccus daliensis]|uniref:Kinase-associated protein B n=1 Tax=Alkalicoccus daliensis TaxID=745820 RepID=A0A1G9ZZQ2_9BACI|nr:kinase-associated lipoprotein B [Alkalicoccus daliensis]SDN26949.1 kinase-associated protein B [Alkalicoccus daliensis]